MAEGLNAPTAFPRGARGVSQSRIPTNEPSAPLRAYLRSEIRFATAGSLARTAPDASSRRDAPSGVEMASQNPTQLRLPQLVDLVPV